MSNKLSSVKPIKPKKQLENASGSKVKTIKELYEADKQAKMKLAELYHEHGDDAMVEFHPVSDSILGLAVTNDKLLRMAEASARKHPESVRFTITQAVRFRNANEGVDFGKERLIVQGFLNYTDPLGQPASAFYELGIFQKPVYVKKPTGYDPQSGEIVGYTTERTNFEDVYSIAFSREQAEALRPHFHKCSFILHTGSRKYTITEDEFINGEFEAVKKHVTPVKKREDGSVY